MSLKKRLIYFAIGLSIGLIFVKIIFDKKDVSFDYLPNDRVLKTLRTKPRIFDQNAIAFFAKEKIDTSMIETFLTDAKVNFSKSKQRLKPCNYYQVETNYDKHSIGLYIKNCDTLINIERAFKINGK